jgi:DNA-binding NarL/FixJ family response regulator
MGLAAVRPRGRAAAAAHGRPLRVALRIGSPLLRARLERAIADDPALVLAAGPDAAQRCDVLLLLEDCGPETQHALAGAGHERGALLLLADAVPPQRVATWLAAGFAGVLSTTATDVRLRAAIRAAAAGLRVLTPDQLPSPAPVAGRAGEPLTARERQVLQLLALGSSNKEIAQRLGISGHTVKYHLQSLFGKLGAGSRTEAVMKGLRQGIVLV